METARSAFCLTVEISEDGRTYHAIITIPEGELSGSVTMNVEYGHDYQVKEIPVSRYKPAQVPVEAVKNAAVNQDQTVTAFLSSNQEAEVTFNNAMTQYEKFSHTAVVTNQIPGNAG